MNSFAAIYDFSLYPYTLGDVFTWNVRSAMAAHEAGRKHSKLVIFGDAKHPHRCFPAQPPGEPSNLFIGELQPAFYSHPNGNSFTLFHDREEFLAYVNHLRKNGEVDEAEWATYLEIYKQRDNPGLLREHFSSKILRQQPINEFLDRYRFVPKLREVKGSKFDVEPLITAQGPDAMIVSIQFRLHDDYLAWEGFFTRAAREFPRVKFVLLGRLQAVGQRILDLPNVITPRALGFNLAHEISLLIRSDLFFGTPGDFAQLAFFTETPYRINNVSQIDSDNYGVPYKTSRLPYANQHQKLFYNDVTTEGLLGSLTAALKDVAEKPARTSSGNKAFDKQTTFRLHLSSTPRKSGQEAEERILLNNVNRAIQFIELDRAQDALPELKEMNRTLSQVVNKHFTIGLLMPNFNHSKFLEKAFGEIRKQTPYPDQFVVVDDGSTDRSKELIKKWATSSAANQAVYLGKNVGVNEAFKIALAKLQTDFFFPRSVDDTFFPEFVAKSLAMLTAYPQAGFVCCQSLKHTVESAERKYGRQFFDSPYFCLPGEVEQLLRTDYLWDAGAVWRTAAFRREAHFDTNMRWLAVLHIADVLALRHGFCYIPEPLMEYNIRPGAFSTGWDDLLRSGEALVASVRDLVQADKADIYPRCVRSGYLSARPNGVLAMEALLNAPWDGYSKPLLLILQGLLSRIDFGYEAIGVPPKHEYRKAIQKIRVWLNTFSGYWEEETTMEMLMEPLMSIAAHTTWNNPLIGFFASYLAKKGMLLEASHLLATKLNGTDRCKAVQRASILIISRTENPRAAHLAWREAVDSRPQDVWFGMEWLKILLKDCLLDEANKLADELRSRNPGPDVTREITEIFSEVANPRPVKFFHSGQIEHVRAVAKAYQQHPDAKDYRIQLKSGRNAIVGYLTGSDQPILEALLAADFGEVYRALLGCGLQKEPLSENEQKIIKSLELGWQAGEGESFDLRKLLSYLLYQAPTKAQLQSIAELAPDWFTLSFLSGLHVSPESTKSSKIAKAVDHELPTVNFPSADHLLQQIETTLQEGNFTQARDLLELAIKMQPDQIELVVASGFASFQLQDFEAAQRQFKRAVDIRPEHQPAHVNLAAVLMATSHGYAAEVVLRLALQRFPKNEELTAQLTSILMNEERYQEAASLFGETIATNPSDIDALVGAAECFCHLGDLETARIACEDALRIDPGNNKAKGMFEMISSVAVQS